MMEGGGVFKEQAGLRLGASFLLVKDICDLEGNNHNLNTIYILKGWPKFTLVGLSVSLRVCVFGPHVVPFRGHFVPRLLTGQSTIIVQPAAK